MKKIIRALGALTLVASAITVHADEKVVLGVAIPTATHGFTGGIVWWANEAKKDLEKAHPDLERSSSRLRPARLNKRTSCRIWLPSTRSTRS